MKHPVLILSLLVNMCCGIVQANTDGTVFLERGHHGIVPCPLVKSRRISPDDVVAMYWYYGPTSRTSLLISYFFGSVAPQNGIPEGVYDIDDEFNLIIENVTDSNEGTYHFEVKPHLKMMKTGHVEVCDKVSPSQSHPTVIGCNQDYDSDKCEARVPYDSTVHNLTCVMEHVKPAVELRWMRSLSMGYKLLPGVFNTRSIHTVRNNTFSTSASIQVPWIEGAEYVCEAIGVAVGNYSRKRVFLTKTHPSTATYDTTPTSVPIHTMTTTSITKAAPKHTGLNMAVDSEIVERNSPETQTCAYMIASIVISCISLLFSAGTIFYLMVSRKQKYIIAPPQKYQVNLQPE